MRVLIALLLAQASAFLCRHHHTLHTSVRSDPRDEAIEVEAYVEDLIEDVVKDVKKKQQEEVQFQKKPACELWFATLSCRDFHGRACFSKPVSPEGWQVRYWVNVTVQKAMGIARKFQAMPQERKRTQRNTENLKKQDQHQIESCLGHVRQDDVPTKKCKAKA